MSSCFRAYLDCGKNAAAGAAAPRSLHTDVGRAALSAANAGQNPVVIRRRVVLREGGRLLRPLPAIPRQIDCPYGCSPARPEQFR